MKQLLSRSICSIWYLAAHKEELSSGACAVAMLEHMEQLHSQSTLNRARAAVPIKGAEQMYHLPSFLKTHALGMIMSVGLHITVRVPDSGVV